VTIPLVKDVRNQAPDAICELKTSNARSTLIINRNAPPFDNPDIRRAMALTLDRKSFIDIMGEGQFKIGGIMMPPPEEYGACHPRCLRQSRATIRCAKEPGGGPQADGEAWLWPDHWLRVKLATRNIAVFRDYAVVLIDQLKEIYIDGELDIIETASWFPKLARKDYQVGYDFIGGAVDDPDALFYPNFALRWGAQLHRILQPRSREAVRSTVDGGDQEKRSTWCGRSTRDCWRTGEADHCARPGCDLLAAAGKGADHHGQQRLQRLAFRRRLARPVASSFTSPANGRKTK